MTTKATIAVREIGSGREARQPIPGWLQVKFNRNLLMQVVMVDEARQRIRRAHTKDRQEVRGGGAKPWRQKGTGRARHASRRSPLWVGGGVTFGPRAGKRSLARITHKMKAQALRAALSAKATTGGVEIWKLAEKLPVKTRELLDQVRLEAGDLVVLSQGNLPVARAARNIRGVQVISAAGLTCRRALGAQKIILDEVVWLGLKKKLGVAEPEGK